MAEGAGAAVPKRSRRLSTRWREPKHDNSRLDTKEEKERIMNVGVVGCWGREGVVRYGGCGWLWGTSCQPSRIIGDTPGKFALLPVSTCKIPVY